MSHKKQERESRILSARECAERIQRMRAEGRLPSLEQFCDAVDRALESLDEPGKMTPERKAAALDLIRELRQALGRQVEIWIAYGMPPSRKHKDNNDPQAEARLRELQSEGPSFS